MASPALLVLEILNPDDAAAFLAAVRENGQVFDVTGPSGEPVPVRLAGHLTLEA